MESKTLSNNRFQLKYPFDCFKVFHIIICISFVSVLCIEYVTVKYCTVFGLINCFGKTHISPLFCRRNSQFSKLHNFCCMYFSFVFFKTSMCCFCPQYTFYLFYWLAVNEPRLCLPSQTTVIKAIQCLMNGPSLTSISTQCLAMETTFSS